MWTRPWKYAEGFLIGGGLLAVGLALQFAFGPVEWKLLAFPVNMAVFLLFITLVVLFYVFRKKVYVFEWMMHGHAAVSALACAAMLTVLTGLIPQILSSWPFVLIYIWAVFITGLAALNHLLRFRLREIPFVLNHLGVFLVLTCAALGSADTRTLHMTVFEGSPEWRALDDEGVPVELDFTVELHRFSVDYYPDNTPRRFASDVSVRTRDGEIVRHTLEVNKPLKVNGWQLYQYGYDALRGSDSPYSVLLLVRDPWLPAVYAGILMMLAGALCLFVFMAPKPSAKEEDGI